MSLKYLFHCPVSFILFMKLIFTNCNKILKWRHFLLGRVCFVIFFFLFDFFLLGYIVTQPKKL